MKFVIKIIMFVALLPKISKSFDHSKNTNSQQQKKDTKLQFTPLKFNVILILSYKIWKFGSTFLLLNSISI